jgi:hypothetical protein
MRIFLRTTLTEIMIPTKPSARATAENEGANWGYSSQANDIGLKTTWVMPSGSLTGTGNGIYYNPANFWYVGTTGGSTPYTFFQVEFGKGASTIVTQNWFYGMMYHDGSGDHYRQFTMPSVTVSPG